MRKIGKVISQHFQSLLIKILRLLFSKSASLIGPSVQSQLHIQTFEFPSYQIRIYAPYHLKEKPLPVVVFYHGGGWTLGDLQAYDRICQYISKRARCLVASVDYRLGPEFKYPAAHEDALSAYEWCLKQLPSLFPTTGQVIIAGDSAGGALCVATAHQASQKKLPLPLLQLLIYPVLDVSSTVRAEMMKGAYPFFRRFAYFILKLHLKFYLGNLQETENLEAFPAASHSLSYSIPTFLLTVGRDILTEAATLYQKKLEQKGACVIRQHYPRAIHGFIQFAGLNETAHQALKKVTSTIRLAFKKPLSS